MPPDNCIKVGELIKRLIDIGDLDSSVILAGEGFLQSIDDDFGQAVILHATSEADTSGT